MRAVLHALACAGHRTVHVLRPAEARLGNYHKEVFGMLPPVVEKCCRAKHDKYFSLCLNDKVSDLVDHVFEHGATSGSISWAVCHLNESTGNRAWFYELVCCDTVFDLIMHFGACGCKQPVFSVNGFADLLCN
jgi:hypothetical protein